MINSTFSKSFYEFTRNTISSQLVVVCERPLTLTSQDVSPLFVSDFDAEHCSASQFQIIYLAFLLLYLFCSKPVNISKEKHILQELHLFEQSEQGLH